MQAQKHVDQVVELLIQLQCAVDVEEASNKQSKRLDSL
jgi:hypothetical protein